MTNAELSGFLAGYLGRAFPAEQLGYAAGWLSKCAGVPASPFGKVHLEDEQYQPTPDTVSTMNPEEYMQMARQQMQDSIRNQRREGTLMERMAPAGPLPGVAPVAESAGMGPVEAGLLGAGAAGVTMLAAYAIAKSRANNKYNVKQE